MVRLALFFLLLSWAVFSDIGERMIPDRIPILIAVASLLPPDGVRFAGALVCLPLFLAGITIGGIGGGDIKLTGACGLVLGLPRAFVGLFAALWLLLVFHAAVMAYQKIKKEKKRAAGRHTRWHPFSVLGCLSAVKFCYEWRSIHEIV